MKFRLRIHVVAFFKSTPVVCVNPKKVLFLGQLEGWGRVKVTYGFPRVVKTHPLFSPFAIFPYAIIHCIASPFLSSFLPTFFFNSNNINLRYCMLC